MKWRDAAGERRNARINFRVDGRLFEPAGMVQFQASVSHPHGEALGPGARSDCAEREKYAFGGTRSQVCFRDEPGRTLYRERQSTTRGRES
jgi:hypothetical protein